MKNENIPFGPSGAPAVQEGNPPLSTNQKNTAYTYNEINTSETSLHFYESNIHILKEVIDKAKLEENGNDKGYFEMNDWKTKLMLLPIMQPVHCDEDQGEQAFVCTLRRR